MDYAPCAASPCRAAGQNSIIRGCGRSGDRRSITSFRAHIMGRTRSTISSLRMRAVTKDVVPRRFRLPQPELSEPGGADVWLISARHGNFAARFQDKDQLAIGAARIADALMRHPPGAVRL